MNGLAGAQHTLFHLRSNHQHQQKAHKLLHYAIVKVQLYTYNKKNQTAHSSWVLARLRLLILATQTNN